jgi:hypothetical protein
MGGQGPAEVVVHRRIVEGHRQHVEHGSDLAADDLDAGLGANDGEKSPMTWIGGPLGVVLGFDLEDLGRLGSSSMTGEGQQIVPATPLPAEGTLKTAALENFDLVVLEILQQGA